MRRPSRRAVAGGAIAWALAGTRTRAEGPVGPCSPDHAADGDIPSEMPGRARRLRPAPGPLGDELEFRRAHGSPGDDGATEDEPARPRRRKR